MTTRLACSLILCALLSPHQIGATESAKRIQWARGLRGSVTRAQNEGRPILIVINALDRARGRDAAMSNAYASHGLVAAARPMICLVANPHDHDRDGTCARYGSTDCGTHRDVLNLSLQRWSNDNEIISPQHVILAPDGTLLWRKEFAIEEGELQRACELALVKVAPARALALASGTRRGVMRELRGGLSPIEYLKRDDPLAPAVLLLLCEAAPSPKWFAALKESPRSAFALVRLYVEDGPAYLEIAAAIDPKRGAWWKQRLKGKPAKVPPPHDPRLRTAFRALRSGDTSHLQALLDALGHPVDGPEVRAALADLVGTDLGADARNWMAHFCK